MQNIADLFAARTERIAARGISIRLVTATRQSRRTSAADGFAECPLYLE